MPSLVRTSFRGSACGLAPPRPGSAAAAPPRRRRAAAAAGAVARAADHAGQDGVREEGACLVGAAELLPDDRLDGGDEALLVEEEDLALRRVDVDVEGGGREAEREVDERVRSLGQHRRVHIVESAF